MTHAVGERFRSPTVNLIIDDNAFLFFCQHIREYAKCPVNEPTEEEQKLLPQTKIPISILRGEGELPDIPIFFFHYKTVEDAIEKWDKRAKRINYNNLCIVMDCKIHATEEILDEFEKLPYDKKVIFSHREDPERWPHNFRYSFYTKEKHGDGVLYRKTSHGLFERQAFEEFDFIQWLNDGSISKAI